MRPAIRVDNLSKQYRIGTQSSSSDRQLRELITDGAKNLWRRLCGRDQCIAYGDGAAIGEFWALKDVSFEVKPGEVVGIIGRNGAGKSTLLKILSRIVEPTSGRCEVRGRMGSLLEVGTGFHPELTGRENIYLNAAILGMRREEIARKFDAIVDFSEVEKFLDTPVKRYSSGMYVRLAFAVAAHIEPKILLVDEVLAVGDLAFQQKCLNHMRTLTRCGMTILLVSHNMAAIQSCCDRAVFLEGGRLTAEGSPVEVIDSYRRAMQNGKGPAEKAAASAEEVSIVGFEMFGEDGKLTREVKFGEAVRIRIDVHAKRRVDHPMINFGIKRGDGVVICNFNNWFDQFEIDFVEGHCSLDGWLPPLRLIPDFFEIHALIWSGEGNHVVGDMTKSMPLAADTFGFFRVVGPALNAGDGVVQTPARKWLFRRGSDSMMFDVNPENRMEHVCQLAVGSVED